MGFSILVDDAGRPQLLVRNVLCETGTKDDAWMKGKRAHAVRLAALVQCDGEKDVGGLRLAIGRPSVIVAAFEVGIVEHEGRAVMSPGRHRDHPRTVCSAQGRPQPRDEMEVSQMVRREVQLIPSRIAGQRTPYDPRTVHQDMKRLVEVKEPVGEGVDRDRVEQIQRLDLRVDSLQRCGGFVLIARRDDDVGAGSAQRPCGLQTNAGTAPR